MNLPWYYKYLSLVPHMASNGGPEQQHHAHFMLVGHTKFTPDSGFGNGSEELMFNALTTLQGWLISQQWSIG